MNRTKKTEKHEIANQIKDISLRRNSIIIGTLILIAYCTISILFIELLTIVLLLELISGAAVIGAAFLLFPILKPYNKILTFGYTIIKTIEGIFIIIAAILLFPLIINPETSSILIFETRDWIYDTVILYLFGMRFLILAYILYQSELVPRFISVWGIISSSIMIVASLINLMTGTTVIPFIISHLPVISNEIFLAIWLMVKGFNEDAIT
ncbi:MAG: DUF4386 domain-containing protein [Candidatus Hermodarchaeota archaeon]